MSEMTAFGYRPGTGQLYMLDSRVKLVSFLLISLSVLKASPLALAVLTLGLIGLIQTLRLSFLSVIKELRYIGLLLFLILIVRAVSVSGLLSSSSLSSMSGSLIIRFRGARVPSAHAYLVLSFEL